MSMAARSGAAWQAPWRTASAAGGARAGQVIPGSATGVVVLAVEAVDHQVDAEAELVIHVAAAAEQHRQPDQVVRGVAGHHLGDPPQLAQFILRPRTALRAGGETRLGERVP